CLGDQRLSTIYSNYTLVKSTARTWSGRSRLDFRAGRLFGSVDPAHQYETQRKTLERHQQLLDSDPLVSEPLTPDAGPARAAEAATVFYENAAPQWRSVNVGAWAWVERAARSLAAERGDLLVVTGVCGLTSLPDAQGNRTPLFLFAQGAQRKMPVPALYWK
ncbi:DsRNase 4, partial [Gryllus bimaculatus]